ncbi:lysostaphin resistance A-like protein [Staphylococcus saprophyticus]|uniref:CPBP family intramembrane metalloprotease n=1 Tax=Mammaliicoccus sciuri TaxID=1296 RepID=A0A517CM03_MAMSC|nr:MULTISPECIES: CPBP family intramembrane glutamic endopeptidase [Staphylococcaceae]QDR66041.1 CPBP family intramembrane metalloprotease [Mammaliicoccus sciuri]
MEQLLEYSIRITPGLVILTLTYILLPKKSIASKLFLLIFGFILIRDSMTPMEFWQFGISEKTVWLRFIDDGLILFVLALTSLGLTFGIIYLNKPLNKYLIWFGNNKVMSLVVGFIGAVIVLAPILMMSIGTPIEERGGVVSPDLLVPLLVLAIFGNFMEEVLFRGYLQGYFEKLSGPWRAVVLSGLLFATGHIFLAITVTDLGVAILLFTLYEGFICAIVRMNHGIIAATLTHGLTIFVLASGIF